MINRFVNCVSTEYIMLISRRVGSWITTTVAWRAHRDHPPKSCEHNPRALPRSPLLLSLTRARFWVSVSLYVYRPDWRRLARSNHERYRPTIFLRLKTISWRVSSRCKIGGGGKFGFLQLVSDILGCFLQRSCTACRQFIHETSSQAVGIIQYTGLMLAHCWRHWSRFFFTLCA